METYAGLKMTFDVNEVSMLTQSLNSRAEVFARYNVLERDTVLKDKRSLIGPLIGPFSDL